MFSVRHVRIESGMSVMLRHLNVDMPNLGHGKKGRLVVAPHRCRALSSLQQQRRAMDVLVSQKTNLACWIVLNEQLCTVISLRTVPETRRNSSILRNAGPYVARHARLTSSTIAAGLSQTSQRPCFLSTDMHGPDSKGTANESTSFKAAITKKQTGRCFQSGPDLSSRNGPPLVPDVQQLLVPYACLP